MNVTTIAIISVVVICVSVTLDLHGCFLYESQV
jgi:hypothetical protein